MASVLFKGMEFLEVRKFFGDFVVVFCLWRGCRNVS